MKKIKYFLQFIIIMVLFIIFRLLGYKNSSNISAIIFRVFGKFFRSNKIIYNNLNNLFQSNDKIINKKFISEIWEGYGRIFSDYVFLKEFRNNKLNNFLSIEGLNILKKIKKENKQVIFVSAHFNNFELMAMEIEKNKIDLFAIYRPLNNIFLNKVMEKLRKKYICKNQIPKGLSGSRQVLKAIKNGSSVALMIDQRVTEGKKIKFFNKMAFTTTLPAQLIKRFQCEVVPVHIERINRHYFNLKFLDPIKFKENSDEIEIMNFLNSWLEKMIIKSPTQWIWTHKRWKL